jgi:hypothetical protein
VAKKGKKKKQKLHHPILISGGIFLVLLVVLSAVWFFGGKTLFIATPAVEKNLTDAKAIYLADMNAIQDSRASEDRIKMLLGKSGNKAIIADLAKKIDENKSIVEKDNTKLNLSVIALNQMSVPLSLLWAQNHLEKGTDQINLWKTNAASYFKLANLYYLLIADITDYKDQVSSQTFDKENADDGISSHTKLKDISQEALDQLKKLSEDNRIELPNTKAYFEKAKTYHEKNIAFYEADKKRDVPTEKTLSVEISSLKDELVKLDAVSDLINFEASHLADSRATLDDEESAIASDYNIFKNK